MTPRTFHRGRDGPPKALASLAILTAFALVFVGAPAMMWHEAFGWGNSPATFFLVIITTPALLTGVLGTVGLCVGTLDDEGRRRRVMAVRRGAIAQAPTLRTQAFADPD